MVAENLITNNNGADYESDLENLKSVERVGAQTNRILNESGITESFYTLDSAENKVKYNLDVVRAYLSKIAFKDGTSAEKSWRAFQASIGSATTAWIMAVQIALEVNGIDAGKIDGFYGPGTKSAVRKFQEKVGFKGKEVDGVPGPHTIAKLLESLGGVVVGPDRKEDKEDEKEEVVEVKVKEEEQDLPEGEVEAGDLVEVPEGGSAEFKEGEGVDKEKEGEQEVVVIVKVGGKVKEIIVIVEIKEGKMKAKKKEEEKKEEKEEVKVKEGEQDLPEGEVEAGDLVEVPEGGSAEFEGGGVDKEKEGEQEVVVIVKVRGKVEKVVVIVEIKDGKMKTKEKEEEKKEEETEQTDREKLDKIEVDEEKTTVKKGDEVDPRGLLKNLPEGCVVVVDCEENGIDTSVEGKVTVKLIVILGTEVRRIEVEVIVEKTDEEKIEEVTGKEDVVVEEGEKVNAEDLVEGLPEGGSAEFKDGEGVDKEKEGDYDVIVIVKVGEEEKEIKVKVKVVVELSDKQKVERVKGKEDVKVEEGEEVNAEDLVEGLPEGGSAEFKEGEGVDKEKEGEQEVVVIVRVGEEVREIIVKVVVKKKEGKKEEEDEEKKEEKEEVKVKEEEQDLPEGEVEAGDLVEVPEGGSAEFEGGGVDKEKEGEQEVVVIVKVRGKVEKVVVVVEIKDGKMKTKEKEEEKKEEETEQTDREKLDKIEVDEEKTTVKKGDEVDPKGLLKNLPEGCMVVVDCEDGIDTSVEGKVTVKLIVILGNEIRRIEVEVIVEKTDEEKLEEVTGKENVEVKEGDEVKAEDLVEGLPEGGSAEFKDGEGVDTSKGGEYTVIVIVKVGDVEKEIEVKVTVEVVVEKTDEEKLEEVEVDEEKTTVKKGDEVDPRELLKNLPEGCTVVVDCGDGIDTSEEGTVTVTLIVTLNGKFRKIEVEVVVEKTDKEKLEEVTGKENVEVKEGEEVKAEDLVEGLPEGGSAEFKDGEGVDTSTSGEYNVIVIVKVGEEEREIEVIVKVVVEEADEVIENDENLTYGRVNCEYIGEYHPNKILTITNKEDLKQFGGDLYDRYDDSYFVNHDLSVRYSYLSSTADKGYYIDNVIRSGSDVYVDYKKDFSGVGKIGAEMVLGEVLFVEVNKGDTVKWHYNM